MDDDTRHEFDRVWSRLDVMDSQGTRGVNALQIQVGDLIRDVSDLKVETVSWQKDHEKQHQDSQLERKHDRRWLIAGVLIPSILVIISAIGLVITYLSLRK